MVEFRNHVAFPPKKESATHGAAVAMPQVLLEGVPPKPTWKLTILHLKGPLAGAEFEVQLTNLSSKGQLIPLEIDGRAVGKHCPNGTILQANLTLLASETGVQQIGNFATYGCEAVPESVALLPAGESITFRGIYPNVVEATKSQHIYASFFLTRNHYQAVSDGWFATKAAEIVVRSDNREP